MILFFVILGNKKDLEDERQVSYEEGALLAKSVGAAFIETSAKTGENVDKAFFGMLCCVVLCCVVLRCCFTYS